jgi:hypothetical protein
VGGGGSETHYNAGRDRENIFGLEGSRAVPASPAVKGKAYDNN